MNATGKWFAQALAFAWLTGMAGPAFALTVSTVGVINPDAVTNGLTVVNSTTNVGDANFWSLPGAATDVASAFTSDTGGVINFDTNTGWTGKAASHTATYGTNQSKSLTISLGAGSGMADWGQDASGGTVVTSGSGSSFFLGFANGAGSPIIFDFSQGLIAWGITQLNRGASRDVTMSFTLADTSVINYALQNQDPAGNNSGTLNWYGFQTTAANPLTKVTITANGFVRFDDMAFIVPEPGTFGMLLVGLCALQVIRRKRG